VTALNSIKQVGLAFVAVLMLAACDSAEERAEEHYNNGLELLEAGDYDRAIVEFRNVFRLNGNHREARHALADTLLTHYNDKQQAYSQYLRIAEQYADDLEARIVLSEIAFSSTNWDEVERHGAKAEELAPDRDRVKAIAIARNYRAAALEKDDAALRDQTRTATALLDTIPENVILRTILLDSYTREGDIDDALTEIDWLLERDPNNVLMWRQRLRLLSQKEDYAGIEAQLQDMVKRFPDDIANKQAMIRFYMSRDQVSNAEAFLRQLATEAPDDNGPRLDLVRFLAQVSGRDAAREAIAEIIPEVSDPIPFRVILAGIDFDEGLRDKAIQALEDILSDNEASEQDGVSEQINDVKVTLARMLVTMENNVGARARVEEVLVNDPGHAEALKMRAAWLVGGDDTDGAIAALRSALDTNPNDAAAMTLMAQAYTRAGRSELAQEFLALAVDASGNAPAETIRYARFLISEERYLPAEDILLPALRLAPQNLDILLNLGQLYMRMGDFSRVEQVIRTIRQLSDPQAQAAADTLEAERLNQQSGPQEAIGYLQELANSADASLASQILLVRAQLANNDVESARALAEKLSQDNPDNPQLKVTLATTEALSGNLETAEEIYLELMEENPNVSSLALALSQLKARQGDPDAAKQVLAEALEKMPQDINLLWARASYLERDGDIEGAIAIYEDLYEANSNQLVVANNLASLLSAYRTDPDSLDRAWRIARRFKDTKEPALQDTYGWIEHQRGNSDVAVDYLESAAQVLVNDPLVQYHLGKIYQALERPEDALKQFENAIKIAGPADGREQFQEARALIPVLQEQINTPPSTE